MNTIVAIASVVLREMVRRKDFYVLFVLTALVTVVLGSVGFFGDASIARYVKEQCLLLIWIAMLVIALTSAARQIPGEKESRTLLPLLAKPVTRGQVIAGKFLGCWLACGACLVVFYVFFALMAATREHETRWLLTVQALWLHWWVLGILVAMGLAGSVLFAAPSSNTTICLVVAGGILVIGRHLNKVAATLAEPGRTIVGALYYAMPHLEWFDVRALVVHNYEPLPWWVCGVATLYAVAYIGAFLSLGWVLFRRKSVV